MESKEIIALPLGAVLVGVFAVLLITFGPGGQARAGKPIVVSGSGIITSAVNRCTNEISDCGDDDPATFVRKIIREANLSAEESECPASMPANAGVSYGYDSQGNLVPGELIYNTRANGSQHTDSTLENCDPNDTKGHFENHTVLKNAIVTDGTQTWQGDLVIDLHGSLRGDPIACVSDTVTTGVFSIKGVSGQLAGAKGHGTLFGLSWPACPTATDPVRQSAGAETKYEATILIPD